MSKAAMEEYKGLMKTYLRIRDDESIPEKIKDQHLCEMDFVWYQLTEEEMREVNKDNNNE